MIDDLAVATRTRPIDAGENRGRRIRVQIGSEIRVARQAHNLSLEEVYRVVGVSPSHGSRLERGVLDHVDVTLLARACAVVGLELSVRAFPGGEPIRDAAHAAMLVQFRSLLYPSLRWATEVPFPTPGDQRAWDGLVSGDSWRYGVEAETSPNDAQALLRRLALKQRDGQVDGVFLLLRNTRRARAFREMLEQVGAGLFPVPGKDAWRHLAAGMDPGGGSIMTLPARPRG